MVEGEVGDQIGNGRLAVPSDRVAHVAEYIQPTTKKGVRAFLGTCGYYHKFVKDFGKVAHPLTQMLKKSEPEQVQWTLEGEQAFVSHYVIRVYLPFLLSQIV